HHTGACAKLCKRCKKRGHEEKECIFRPTDGNPREVECWECGAKGHTKNRYSRQGVSSGGKCAAKSDRGCGPNDCLNSLSCVKAAEKKPADIRVACEFPEVFPDDLSGFPPV
nr:hypothetical protein [Tanacetum cinerariifolium]